jgi:hypothetical protein
LESVQTTSAGEGGWLGKDDSTPKSSDKKAQEILFASTPKLRNREEKDGLEIFYSDDESAYATNYITDFNEGDGDGNGNQDVQLEVENSDVEKNEETHENGKSK